MPDWRQDIIFDFFFPFVVFNFIDFIIRITTAATTKQHMNLQTIDVNPNGQPNQYTEIYKNQQKKLNRIS